MIPNWAITELVQRFNGSKAQGKLVRECAERFGVSKATVYRRLARFHGRKAQMRISTEERQWCDLVSGFVRSCMDQNGTSISTRMAIAELEKRGKIPPGALRRQRADAIMHELGMTRKAWLRERPCVALTAAGPNAVHEVDFSPSKQFRIDKGLVRQTSEFSKLQPRTRLQIGSVLDVYSRCNYMQAYEAEGESIGLAVEFLHDAWSEKMDTGFPFHGLPWRVYSDQGGAFKGKEVQALLGHLLVDWTGHERGRSRATGAVERKFLDTARWQCLMKSRLGRNGVSLREFNSWLFEECVERNNREWRGNSQLLISSQRGNEEMTKAGGTRKATRFEAWSTIGDEEIRRVPEKALWLCLTAVGEWQRKVSPRMTISFDGREYYVGESDLVGASVEVFRLTDKRLYVRFGGKVYPTSTETPANLIGSMAKQPRLASWELNQHQALAAVRKLGIGPTDIAWVRGEKAGAFMPRAGRAVEVRSQIADCDADRNGPPVVFTEIWQAKAALSGLVGDLKELDWETLAAIERKFGEAMERNGEISAALVERMAETVTGASLQVAGCRVQGGAGGRS